MDNEFYMLPSGYEADWEDLEMMFEDMCEEDKNFMRCAGYCGGPG